MQFSTNLTIALMQGCHSYKISKFPDFSLTLISIFPDQSNIQKLRNVLIFMNTCIYLNYHLVHACIGFHGANFGEKQQI